MSEYWMCVERCFNNGWERVNVVIVDVVIVYGCIDDGCDGGWV